jgi:hypothetical protein
VHPVDVTFAFVEVAQQVGVEVHGPDAVRHLFEPDVFIDQGGGEGDPTRRLMP